MVIREEGGSAVIGVFLLLWLLSFPASSLAQRGGWEQEWNRVVTAARKEGKVVVRGPTGAEARQKISAAFHSKFGIPLEFIAGRGSEVVSRLMLEHRAGHYTVDALMLGLESLVNTLYPQKMLAPVKPLLMLPDVVNPAKWKAGDLWLVDPEEKYILRLLNSLGGLLSINTHFVKSEELRSIKDLLHPKWRGRIGVSDPRISPGSNLASLYYSQLGEEFFKRLYIEQKPVISRDTRQLAEWLARGVHAVSVGASTNEVKQMRKDGLPVTGVYSLPDFPGMITAGAGLLVVLDRAPHPNAAQVFVNWIASKGGLEILGRSMAFATARNDVDESYMPPEEIPHPGLKYFDGYDWQFTTSKQGNVIKRIKEILQ